MYFAKALVVFGEIIRSMPDNDRGGCGDEDTIDEIVTTKMPLPL